MVSSARGFCVNCLSLFFRITARFAGTGLILPRSSFASLAFWVCRGWVTALKSLVRAASVLHYSKESDYRNILFHLKYWRHPQVGVWLAKVGAQELIPQGFFEGIDCIVPMPITYWKEIKRGYNQCSFIAKGIRKATGLPIINNAVKCVKAHSKQAGLGKYQRWNNAQDLFAVTDPSALAGKHVLLVDDVITTGATLCSLIDVMEEKIPNLKVSVFTLAVAD